jgi:hypothetical protein
MNKQEYKRKIKKKRSYWTCLPQHVAQFEAPAHSPLPPQQSDSQFHAV